MQVQTITSNHVTESQVHCFVTEASTIGLRPGHWPNLLKTELGNGCEFKFGRMFADGSAIYWQLMGCIALRVLND